jgi:hypothetical protein
MARSVEPTGLSGMLLEKSKSKTFLFASSEISGDFGQLYMGEARCGIKFEISQCPSSSLVCSEKNEASRVSGASR